MSSALNTPYTASILARIQRYRSYQEMKHIIKKIIKKIIIKEEIKIQRERKSSLRYISEKSKLRT